MREKNGPNLSPKTLTFFRSRFGLFVVVFSSSCTSDHPCQHFSGDQTRTVFFLSFCTPLHRTVSTTVEMNLFLWEGSCEKRLETLPPDAVRCRVLPQGNKRSVGRGRFGGRSGTSSAHGGGHGMSERGIAAPTGAGGEGGRGVGGSNGGSGASEESKGRRHKFDRGGNSAVSGSNGPNGSGAATGPGDGGSKGPPPKKRKGGIGWRGERWRAPSVS